LALYSARGLWHFLDSPEVLATTSKLGFGWHGLDMQHGLWSEARIISVLATAPGGNIAVRLRSGSYADIGFALDAGAAHIIVPMVNTAEEAREAVDAARYAPHGARSWGPMSALFGEPVLTPQEANDRLHLSVMIESAEGLENLEAILGVAGINSVFVGPVDLAMSLGTDVDSLLAAKDSPLAFIAKTCHDRRIEVGAFAGSPSRASAFEALGYDWVATATDMGLLKAGAAQALES
jgi:4-hydroxy-2-oxoheptanedioate aldolase